MKKYSLIFFALFFCFSTIIFGQIPTNTLVQIVKAEDERRWDATLENLLKNPNPKIRERAALAVGRIGNEDSVSALVNLLKDSSEEVQVMTTFALGEIESAKATPAIIEILKNRNYSVTIRARAVEAAGKISAANPKDVLTPELNKAIFETVNFENVKRSNPDDEIILLGLTAILRARPEGGENLAAEFLRYSNPRIRADALNTLARLRSKTVNEKSRDLLRNDSDPVVRANAARMLGVGEDKTAIDLLLNTAAKDTDSRVRVNAIRALGSLKDVSAADKLIPSSAQMSAHHIMIDACKPTNAKFYETTPCNNFKNEYLEIATTLGRLLPNTNNQKAIEFLDDFNKLDYFQSSEINIALAKIAPKILLIKS